MAPEEAARQGDAAQHAWSAFDDRDRAVAFMNAHQDDLGGRPIDVAIASDDGLSAVKRAIDVSAGENPGDASGVAADDHARPDAAPSSFSHSS